MDYSSLFVSVLKARASNSPIQLSQREKDSCLKKEVSRKGGPWNPRVVSACAALLPCFLPSFHRRRLDINALGSSIQRRLLQCNNGLYEYPVPRDVSGLVWRLSRVSSLDPRKGEREDVGPAGSPILIHSITADNDRVNGPLTLDELRGAPATNSLLRVTV